MKALKIVLLLLVVFVVVVLIAASFGKDEYKIEREVTINKPRQQVFDYIKLLKNQNNYSKWAKMDPNAKMEYTGTDGTVGFKSAWDSQDKNVGKGEQTIAGITEGQRVDYDLHFIKPFDGRANAYIATEDAGGGTKVRWAFMGKSNYMMKVMHLFMDMDKMIGDDLNTGLTNLKAVLEK